MHQSPVLAISQIWYKASNLSPTTNTLNQPIRHLPRTWITIIITTTPRIGIVHHKYYTWFSYDVNGFGIRAHHMTNKLPRTIINQPSHIISKLLNMVSRLCRCKCQWAHRAIKACHNRALINKSGCKDHPKLSDVPPGWNIWQWSIKFSFINK